MIDDVDKIKKLDYDGDYKPEWYGQELPENGTPIKAALAKVIDSIFDLRAKNMGLHSVRDLELAKSSSVFVQEKFPGYDYVKRYTELANVDFKLIIEFDGTKWVRNQNFDDQWRQITNNWTLNKQAIDDIRRNELGTKVRKATKQMEDTYDKKQMSYLGLFETKQDLIEYIKQIFALYQIGDMKEDAIKKAFMSRLVSCEKKSVYQLNINSKSIETFCNMINSPK